MKKVVIILGVIIVILLLVLFFVPARAPEEVQAPAGPAAEQSAGFDENDYLDEALEELDAVE